MFRGKELSDRERGATLVEMAIVLPVLLLMVIGLMEMGIAFKSYLTVSAAVRDGGRVAALAGNEPDADCSVLQEVGGALQDGDELAGLQRVDIYKASKGTGAIIGLPNSYTLDIGGDPVDCDDWTRHSYGYPETSRETSASAIDGLDLVGVRVVVDRSWIVGLEPFNGPYTVDELTLRRLEPESF